MSSNIANLVASYGNLPNLVLFLVATAHPERERESYPSEFRQVFHQSALDAPLAVGGR